MTVEMKPLSNDLIDALLADYKKPEDLIDQNGLLKQLTKALVEQALPAELTDHQGRGKNQLVANEAGNIRNGRSKKPLKGDFGEQAIPPIPGELELNKLLDHLKNTCPRRSRCIMARKTFQSWSSCAPQTSLVRRPSNSRRTLSVFPSSR